MLANSLLFESSEASAFLLSGVEIISVKSLPVSFSQREGIPLPPFVKGD
jgi:hypothetical protein